MSGPNVSNSKISQAIDRKYSARFEVTTDEIKENCNTFGNEMSWNVTHKVDFLGRCRVNNKNNGSILEEELMELTLDTGTWIAAVQTGDCIQKR